MFKQILVFILLLGLSWGGFSTEKDKIVGNCFVDTLHNHFTFKKRKAKKQLIHEQAVRLPIESVPKFKEADLPLANYFKEVYNDLDTSKFTWADSVFNTLTPTERLAQLFMIPAYSNKGKEHKEQIAKLISEYGVGGIIFFQGGPVRQASLTNYYQSLSKVPLMISIDAEWGLAMRLDSTFKFPRQMMLGAIQDDSLIYRMGAEIAKHCKRIGTHVNFAPDIDINNNPLNPVISNRSFGEDKVKVAQKGIMYMRGMQDQRVLTSGKHFPGHGDTDSDSHFTLPVIKHSKKRLDTLELYPFIQLFRNGLLGTMVAHLYIPQIDSTRNLASTLSYKIVNDWLKEDLYYNGLIFTDALNMKGVAKFYEPGIVDLKALLAGNDILLNAEDVPKAIEQIQEAIYQGQITWDEINARCLKVLRFKEWLGLNKYQPVSLKNIYEDINTPESELINRLIIEQAQTVLINRDKIIPIKSFDQKRIATLAINEDEITDFQKCISIYTPADHYFISKNAKIRELDTLLKQLSDYDLVIAGIFNIQSKPESNFGMPAYTSSFLDSLDSLVPTILSVFGNAYCLSKLKNLQKLHALILSYEDNTQTQVVNAQVIFGAIGAKGRLPVSIPPAFKYGDGLDTDTLNVIKLVLPVQIAFSNKIIKEAEALINNSIKEKAFPGCQVYAAKNGKVFYNKSFGKYTYNESPRVTNESIYDLASVTKIASSALALMKLVDLGFIRLDDSLGTHLPQTIGTNKASLKIRDVLTHQAGLISWIPFFSKTIVNDSIKNTYYSEIPTDTFSIRVAESMYLRMDYVDSIYHQIYFSELGPKQYNYSDLGYYFMKQIVESYTHTTLDSFVVNTFYKPMGLWTMRYKPRTFFDLNKIVPTEEDKIFRKQLLQGDVHDQGAAMLGGVGGHAGLFSSATHLGILMQMLLNEGNYGGVQYLKPETVKEFTACPFCNENGNRRGVCFDKPEPNPEKESPTASSASQLSFGHSGFTGTYTWVDPQSGLVFVFLSNRVHPDSENKKLIKLGIRTKLHDMFNREIIRITQH